MEKLRSTLCSSCCFRATDVETLAREHGRGHHRQLSYDVSAPIGPHPPSSPSSTRSNGHEGASKARRRILGGGFVSRFARQHNLRHHRRGYSADFRYDALSYALNFDEGHGFDEDREGAASPAEYHNFSSRLPRSPPPPCEPKAVKV